MDKKDLLYPTLTYYSDPAVITRYTQVGLTPVEELVVPKYFTPPGEVLVAGCGTGRTCIPLAQRGHKVTGFDVVPEMINVAKRQARENNVEIDLRVMNATEMDFPPSSFRYVFFPYNGFEHLIGKGRQAKFLRDAARLLKPGGVLIFSCRSGLAFNKRLWADLWMVLTHPWQRLRWGKDYALGDKHFGKHTLHYTNPFRTIARAKAAGLTLELINASKRLLDGKPPGRLVYFSDDREIYYVFRKTSSPAGA